MREITLGVTAAPPPERTAPPAAHLLLLSPPQPLEPGFTLSAEAVYAIATVDVIVVAAAAVMLEKRK